MPALDGSHLYYVQYVLTSGAECSTRMNAYFGSDIAPYPVAGAALHAEDFDVASFNQIDPSLGASVDLPYTFSWYTRTEDTAVVEADNFAVRLYNSPLTVQFYSADLGDVGQYEVTPDDVFGFTDSTTYRWKPYVFLNGGLSFGYACYDTFSFNPIPGQDGLSNSGPVSRPAFSSVKAERLADSVVDFQMP